MSNERPSDHLGGYWLASTPSSMPSHAYPDWLMQLLGQMYQGNPFANAPSAFPSGNPQGGPSHFPYNTDFASRTPSGGLF